jgi:hypothetical protein
VVGLGAGFVDRQTALNATRDAAFDQEYEKQEAEEEEMLRYAPSLCAPCSRSCPFAVQRRFAFGGARQAKRYGSAA